MEAHALRSSVLGRPRRTGPLRRIAGDERLVELVRAGREDAFEVVFDRYHRPILSFCRHMLGSQEEAEDATQHCFLAAYNALARDDRPIHLRPWLYTIARNHCYSQLRARREQASLEDVEPSVDGLASEVQRRADLKDMLRDLAELPEDQRAAIVLAELGDLSHDEIADVVGCQKGKVKALVFQARSSLASSREARDTPCTEIREQLATLTGGALRRTTLRRHLRECEGCRRFRDEVKHQRQAMAVLLPVVPSAGLKLGVLSGVGASHAAGGGGAAAAAGAGGAAAAAGAGGGGGLAAVLANAGIAKIVAAAAVAAGAAGSGAVAVDAITDGAPVTAPSVSPAPTSSAKGTREAFGATPGSASRPASPTRAGGAHAPGKSSGGVANGRNAKGERGRSRTAPGVAGTSPGRAGTSPGRAGTSPGRDGTAPGRTRKMSDAPRGRSETQPTRSRRPSTSGERTRSRGRPQDSPGAGVLQAPEESATAPARAAPKPVLPDVTRALPGG